MASHAVRPFFTVDVGNFDSAVNFAAFVDADRIEVVLCDLTALPAETAAWRSFGNRSTV
jgi:hypothetical protein